jgi:pimeloyl-ACP methyl ester carboxylesterase
MADPIILADHAGARLAHGKPKVNGVEIHYAIGGAGEPVFLLHGVPKTMSYWRHVVPLLTPHYTVIAVDNRGAGGSQRPMTGYDTATMADDVAELATHLGFDQFRVAGEDWGAAIAYAVAAFHRPRVQQLVFRETLLPGLPAGEPDPSLAPDDGRTGWHFTFLSLPNLPELLLAGRERPFWTYFARRQMWDPSALAGRTSTKWCTRPSSRAAPGPSRRCTAPARPTPNRTARITPTRSAARSWPSARRPTSGTRYPNSSRKWPPMSAAP